MSAFVPCECCKGTGRRPLTTTEARTLLVVSNRWEDTMVIACRLPGVGKTSVNNRLDGLLALGLVEKRPHPTSGRVVQWRRL